MRWDLQIPTILRSTSFSTCHQCHSQCSLQNTLAELSHSDHLGTLSKDCSRELQATGKWELAMPWGFFHAEFWDWTAWCHDFSLLLQKGYMQPSIPISSAYIYLSIYAHLSVSTYLYMSIPDVLYPCLMCADCADHGTHFPARGHVLLGELGWALGSRPSWSHHTTYLYNMIVKLDDTSCIQNWSKLTWKLKMLVCHATKIINSSCRALPYSKTHHVLFRFQVLVAT